MLLDQAIRRDGDRRSAATSARPLRGRLQYCDNVFCDDCEVPLVQRHNKVLGRKWHDDGEFPAQSIILYSVVKVFQKLGLFGNSTGDK